MRSEPGEVWRRATAAGAAVLALGLAAGPVGSRRGAGGRSGGWPGGVADERYDGYDG